MINRYKFPRSGLKAMCLSLVMGAFLVGCSDLAMEAGTERSFGTPGENVQMGLFSLKVYDETGALVFSDAEKDSTLRLQEGITYDFHVDAGGSADNVDFSMAITQVDTVALNPPVRHLNLKPGSNSISFDTFGDFSLELKGEAVGFQPRVLRYLAEVSCERPTFTQDSLNANGLSVTGSGDTYQMSASGVVTRANGMPPYECAWDPTGTGILSTEFKPCNQVQSALINYVGVRSQIGVIVRDACRTTHSVQSAQTLKYIKPVLGGDETYIYGKTSNAKDKARGDRRIDQVEYLATNRSRTIVTSSYSSGRFTIQSAYSYGMTSSETFGMRIEVSGIVDDLDYATRTGSIDMSGAKINMVRFSTDQYGDRLPAASFSDNRTCVLSDAGAEAVFSAGTPCQNGSGSGNKVLVKVWGKYACTDLKNAQGSVVIEGEFTGFRTMADSCVGGGGGGGGGGVDPIRL